MRPPPAARMCGIAARAQRYAAFRSTLMPSSHRASSISESGMRPVDRSHVDQHVEPSERRRCSVYKSRALTAARQVRLQHDGATAKRAHGFGSLLSFGLGSLIRQRDVESRGWPTPAQRQHRCVWRRLSAHDGRHCVVQGSRSDPRQRLSMTEEVLPRRLFRHAVLGGSDIEHRGTQAWADLVPAERHRDWGVRPPSHGKRRHDRLAAASCA